MPNVQVLRAEVHEDNGAWLLWRVVGANSALILQAHVTDVDIRYFDLSRTDGISPDTPVYSLLAQSPVGLVFDTLQVDGFWKKDVRGYNLRYQYRPEFITAGVRGGKVYRVCVDLNCTTGSFAPFGWGKITRIAELSMMSRLAA